MSLLCWGVQSWTQYSRYDLTRSLMKLLNKTEPSVDPWVTLLVTGLQLDFSPQTSGPSCSTSFGFTSLSAHSAYTSTGSLWGNSVKDLQMLSPEVVPKYMLHPPPFYFFPNQIRLNRVQPILFTFASYMTNHIRIAA